MKIELNNDRKAGIVVTVVFHIALLLVFMLMSLKPPYPPAPQLGVEVNLGDSETGSGEIQPENSASTPTQTSAAPKSSNERVITQNTEQTVNMGKVTKTTQTQPQEVKEEPKTDSRYMFSSDKIKSNGGSQGITTGPGDQGVKNGNPNATNYTGVHGNGNTPSYKLDGRKSKSLPTPSYDANEQGTVVVKIWVDKNGRVTAAEPGAKGSTTSNARLQSLAYQAAMKSSFDVNADAPDIQVGYITYVFVLK